MRVSENGRKLSVWAVILLAAVMLLFLPQQAHAKTVSAAQVRKAADAIVSKQTKKIKKKDKEKKLEKVFRYADKAFRYKGGTTPEAFVQAFVTKAGRTSNKVLRSAAYNMLKKKKGTCLDEAMGLAYLIRRATGYTVYLAVGETDAFTGKEQQHSWVEVKIGGQLYAFDSNLDRQQAGKSLKWYRIPTDGSDELYSHYRKKWSRKIK